MALPFVGRETRPQALELILSQPKCKVFRESAPAPLESLVESFGRNPVQPGKVCIQQYTLPP